ncbi:MAG: hypothetical protein LBL13_05750 [Bacteroidales bacterium]|jgi:hypothetical protein|nr:hypothetical protein [Bacteroidales bacterium]
MKKNESSGIVIEFSARNSKCLYRNRKFFYRIRKATSRISKEPKKAAYDLSENKQNIDEKTNGHIPSLTGRSTDVGNNSILPIFRP